MTKFLTSGQRRDLVILVYALEDPREQELKRALEDHYEERVKPRAFYGAMETLEEHGFVEKRADGVHDRYTLTDAGERALLEHVDWVTSMVP